MSQSPSPLLAQIVQQANAHFESGQLPRAEALYRQVLAVEAQNPEALHGMGLIALRVNRPQVAVDLLTTSARLRAENPNAHMALGNALLFVGRVEEAIASFRQAVALKPDFPAALCNLGTALQQTGQLQEAVEALELALRLKPDMMEAHNNLGNALQSQGQFEQAIAAYRSAMALRPDVYDTQNHLATALIDSGRVTEAIAAATRALTLDLSSAAAHTNLLAFLAFDPQIGPKQIFEAHRRWNDQHAKPLAGLIPKHPNNRSPERRLRIGYVSPDLREHPVAYFFEGLLGAHRAEQVETYCYADLQRRPTAAANRLEQLANQWRNITGYSDERLAATIFKDQIDILVDLAAHTPGNRLLVFARKPAPVQVTYLGYPNTSGLDAIDYRMTDVWADPKGTTEQYYSEQLVRLPETFACYQPPRDAPPVGPLPAQAANAITFGSFNRLAKINHDVIRAWAQILRKVPNSRLLLAANGLQDSATADRFRSQFTQLGIIASRLEFVGYQSPANYLALHRRVDILLDTFPVNGHTLTCHALWMGVPVVTLAGVMHVNRLGASVLNNLGLPELIASNPTEYVEIAQRLPADLPKLAVLRSNLRQRMTASPLMNYPRFAEHVESAYRIMWRRWCEQTSG